MKKVITTIIRIMFLALFIFLVIKGKTMLWFALFGVSLILALFFGRIYCGYICPMNTIMSPVEWLSKKLKLQTNKIPKLLISGKIAWIGLGLSILTMLIFKKFMKINLPIMMIWLVISVIVSLRYKPSVFHNLICPFGTLQRLFGKFAFFTKKVDANSCVGCMLCKKACPADAIKIENNKAIINKSLCHQCTKCQDVCPKNAIHYKK